MKKQVFAFVLFLCLLQINTSSIFATPLINEFSSADSSDWIEIYNSGADTIDLSLYRIRDLTTNNKLDLSGSLSPSGFAAFDWSNKLNNGGDLIKLILTSDELIVDQVTYGDQGGLTAPSSTQTGGRQPDGGSSWMIFASSSKNSSNNSSSVFSPPTATPTKTPTPTKSPTPTKTPTQPKTSSSKETREPTKTPTPKISFGSTNIDSPKSTSSNTSSTKTANSAKIAQNFKTSSRAAQLKVKSSEKKEEQAQVLGTKDSDFSFVPIVAGIALVMLGGGWFIFKNRQLIKVWMRKE